MRHQGLTTRKRLGGYVNIKQLQQGLDYCGRVEAVRQTYHVFQAKDSYLVLSFARSKDRKGSGYFNLINSAAVEYVQGRMGGHSGVTAKDVVQAGSRTKHSRRKPRAS